MRMAASWLECDGARAMRLGPSMRSVRPRGQVSVVC